MHGLQPAIWRLFIWSVLSDKVILNGKPNLYKSETDDGGFVP